MAVLVHCQTMCVCVCLLGDVPHQRTVGELAGLTGHESLDQALVAAVFVEAVAEAIHLSPVTTLAFRFAAVESDERTGALELGKVFRFQEHGTLLCVCMCVSLCINQA